MGKSTKPAKKRVAKESPKALKSKASYPFSKKTKPFEIAYTLHIGKKPVYLDNDSLRHLNVKDGSLLRNNKKLVSKFEKEKKQDWMLKDIEFDFVEKELIGDTLFVNLKPKTKSDLNKLKEIKNEYEM